MENDCVTGIQLRIGGENKTIKTNHVVCATPLKEVGRLIPGLTDDEKRVTQDFTYSQFPLAVFFMKRRMPGNQWAYVFSRTEGYKTSFTSDAAFKCDQMVPSGKSIMQAWFCGDAGMELVDEPDDKIIALAKKEMTQVIPTFEDEVESVEMVRHHTGMSRWQVGMYPRVRNFLKSAARFKGIHFVGDYYGHSTIETVVQSAHRSVDKLLGED